MEVLSTPEKIIEATKVLLAQRRYDNISIRDVARKTKVAHTTVIYYFNDKESLLLAVFESILNEDKSKAESFVGLIKKYGGIWTKYPVLAYMLNKSFIEDSLIKTKFFDISRKHIIPQIKNTISLHEEDVEFYYVFFISLTFHPFIANIEGEVDLAPQEFFEKLTDCDLQKFAENKGMMFK